MMATVMAVSIESPGPDVLGEQSFPRGRNTPVNGRDFYQRVLFPQSPHEMPAPRPASSRDSALPPRCPQGFGAPICAFLNLFFSLSMKGHPETRSRFQANTGSKLLVGNQTFTQQWIQGYHSPGHRDC